jgi:hypothetical protein
MRTDRLDLNLLARRTSQTAITRRSKAPAPTHSAIASTADVLSAAALEFGVAAEAATGSVRATTLSTSSRGVRHELRWIQRKLLREGAADRQIDRPTDTQTHICTHTHTHAHTHAHTPRHRSSELLGHETAAIEAPLSHCTRSEESDSIGDVDAV